MEQKMVAKTNFENVFVVFILHFDKTVQNQVHERISIICLMKQNL